MNIRELAKRLAIENKTIQADRYVQDPNYNMNEFRGREMLFPKRWVTLAVLDADTQVKV